MTKLEKGEFLGTLQNVQILLKIRFYAFFLKVNSSNYIYAILWLLKSDSFGYLIAQSHMLHVGPTGSDQYSYMAGGLWLCYAVRYYLTRSNPLD